jgi:hypothetical protein
MKIHGNEKREEVVTVVDNERCDGVVGSPLSEASTAMSSIWY